MCEGAPHDWTRDYRVCEVFSWVVLDDGADGATLTDLSGRAAIAKLVSDWLERKIETPRFISEYWRLRNCLLDAHPEVFTGRFGILNSNLETALNIYADLIKMPYEIDEQGLRRVGADVLPGLKAEVPN